MLTGVTTLILAAATAALPFTPPAGWVQLPTSAVSSHASSWQGPKTAHGAAPTFSAVAFPFPGTVDILATLGHRPKSMSIGSGVMMQLSNVAIRLCGTPARLVTSKIQVAGVSSVVQQEVSVKNGYAYILMYTRPSGSVADVGVVHAMRAFCPSGSSVNPQIALPSAWNKSIADLQMAGMWMGSRPGEMMMLMRGSPMSSLDKLYSRAQKQTLKDKSGKNLVKITERKSVPMCGYPGMRVAMTVNAGPMPLKMQMALTQGAGKAYMLMYTEIGSNPVDPAAVSALQTLCVTQNELPSPAPSASAAPAASLAPSASPSPSPSPSPTP